MVGTQVEIESTLEAELIAVGVVAGDLEVTHGGPVGIAETHRLKADAVEFSR